MRAHSQPERTALYRYFDAASKAVVALQGEGALIFKAGHGVFVAHPGAPSTLPVESEDSRRTFPKVPHDWFWQFGFPG